MLLDFIPCKLGRERIHLDPLAVEEISEEEMHVGGQLHKVACIVMESGAKHLVLDDDRTAADRINNIRLLSVDPEAFAEETEE